MLEDVFESAKDSAGSAQEELNKYLDSIDGRVQKLQNHLQELAVVNINNDWIKVGISLIDTLIQGVTKLTESLGGINIAIGTILGTIGTVRGFGFFDSGKDDQQTFLGKLFSNRKIVKDEQKNHDKYVVRSAGYQDQSILDLGAAFDESESAYNAITTIWGELPTFFDDLSDESQQSLSSIWRSVEDGSATVGDLLQQGLEDFPEQMSEIFTNASEEYETGMARIKGIAASIGNLAINSLISIAGSFVISKFVPWVVDQIDELVHHSDRVIERGKEAQEAINDMYSEFEKGNKEIEDISISINVENANTNSVQENLDAIAERYVELKKGVNEYTNANKNLTTDQYKEYLELCNKIAQKYPELVKGYDSQGNAILRLGTNAEDCKTELASLYDMQLDVSAGEFSEKLKVTFDGISEDFRVAAEEAEKLKKEIQEVENTIENLNKGELNPTVQTDLNGNARAIEFRNKEQYEKFRDIIKTRYESYAADNNLATPFNELPLSQEPMWLDTADGLTGTVLLPVDVEFITDKDYIDEVLKQVVEETAEQATQTLEREAKNLYDKELAANRRKAAANVNMIDAVTKGLKYDDVFPTLNETVTNAILSNIGQFDTTYVVDNFGENVNDFVDYIVDLIGGIPDEMQEEIANALNDTNYKKLNINDYMAKIYDKIFTATGENEDLTKELFKYLGISENIRNYLSQRQEIFNVLEPLGMTEDQMRELTLDQIPRGLEIVRSGIIENLDQFYKELEKVNTRPEAVKNGLFSDILNDEEYKNASDAIKEKLTALSTAIETFREKGSLSGEDAKALMDQGLNFDYSLESLNEKSVGYLKQWVELLHQQADEKNLGTKGLGELDNYLRSLIESYQTLDISAQDVMDNLMNTRFDSKFDSSAFAQKFKDDFNKEFKKEFEDELGSEEDRQILFYLAADPESANWTIDEWRKQFDNAKLTFHFVADTTEIDKQIEELNKAIERRNNARANVESKQALKQAGGKQLNASDYDDLLAFDQADIDDYTEQYAKVQKKIAYAKKGKGTYWEMLEEQYNQEAQTIETQLNNAQQKQIQDLYAKQNAPLDAIKKQFTEIQQAAEATQQEITKLENVGKSATADQYEALIGFSQAQISNLQEQKQFYTGLMEWLAGNEDFGVDSDYYKDAEGQLVEIDGQLIQLQKDVSDTRAKLDEVYSSTSFEYLLTNKDSDKSVTQIYQKFEGFISRYKGYIDQIKNGEKIDFDDLIASDAEFAGVDNIEKLKERIGELSAEKLVDFVNDFSAAISGLDRDSAAFQKASSFITQAINDIDFKNIDINAEAVQQLITDKIFSTEALKGRDNYKAAAWGQEVYAAVNAAIEDGADLASFVKVAMMPGFYEMTPDEVIAQMGDIKAGVLLEITNKEQFQQELAFIEAEMANAQAHQENTEQKRNREESQGNYENSEQYIEDEKENILTQIKDLEKQKADLYKKENENYARLWDGSLTLGSNEYNALIKQRDTEATNFQTQIDKLKNSIEDLDFEKLLVGANEYDQAIEKYKTSNQKFMTELGKYDEYTEVPDSLFKSIETNLYNQSEQYRLKKEFYEGLLGLDGITEYQRTLIEGYITETEGQYQSLINEMNEYITKQLTDSDEKDLAMLKSRKSVLQNKQQDKTMTTKDYEELDEIDQKIELIYGDIVKKLTDFINDESTDPLLKNAAEVMLNSFQEELNNITIERNKNEDAKQLLPIQGMEKNLAAMVEGGDKVKKEISDIQDLGEELVPDSLYGDLEDWANAQLFWIEKIRDAYLLLADAEEKEGNTEVAQQYRDAAEALTEKVDNANEDIRQAKQGVEDNYLNSLETEAQIIGDQMDDIREKLEDTKRVASVEDYNEALKIVGNSIENLNKQHDYWSEKLAGVNEGTTLWKTYKSNLDGVDSNLKAATDEQEKFNKAIQDIKINDIQNKIDEYNTSLTNLQNDIKMNEAKGINKSMEDFLAEDELYDNIIEEANNLKAELDAEYFAKLYTFAEDENGEMIPWKGSQDYKDLVAQRAAAIQAAWDAEYNKEQNKHEEELLPIKQLQDELKELQLAGQYIQREYDNIVAAGGELSDEQYQVQLTNLGEQRDKLEEIERMYQQLADQHKGDAFGIEMLEALDGVQAQIDAIDDQELDINVQMDTRELTHLQNDMTVLQRDAERLKEKLDGTEAPATKGGLLGQLISNNQEQMQNLAKQVVEYQEQMNKIKNEDDDYAVNKQYIQLVENISTAESNMNQLISSTMEYKKALEQLPIDRINQTIAGNEAKLGYEEAKRNNASAQGEVLGEDDYAITLRALESNLDARRKALEIAKTDLENAEHNYDETGLESDLTELQNARTALTTAQTEATEAETSYINAQNEANTAALNQHERRLAELDNRRAELEMAQQVLESLSGERSSQNIADEYRVANDIKKELEAELTTLEENPLSDAFENEQKRLGILKLITAEETTINNLIKESAELPAVSMKKTLEKFQEAGDGLQKQIQMYQKAGKEVPDEIFETTVANLNAQISQNANLRDFYNGLANTFSKIPGVSDFFKNIAKQYQDAIDNLTSEKIDTQNMIDEKGLTHLGYEMDDLKKKGEELQEILNKEGTPKFVSDYENAIENAIEQNENLSKQAEEIRGNLVGLKFDDPNYQTYMNQLDEIHDAQQANIDSIREWQTAINMLNFNRASEGLSKYIEGVNKELDKQSNRVSLGYRMTQEDLLNNRSSYLTIRGKANNNLTNIKNRMDEIEVANPSTFMNNKEFQELQTLYDEQVALEEEYKQKIEEINKEIVWFPVEEMQREQKEIQRIYGEITRSIEELNQNGFQTPEYMLTGEIGAIDNEYANLEAQRDKMIEIRDKFATPLKLFGWYDEIQDQIDDVGSQLDALEDKKREIQIEIDTRPIQNYENYLGHLDSEADVLNDKLDHLETSDMSEADILAALEENARKRRSTIHNELIEQQKDFEEFKQQHEDANYQNNDKYREYSDAIDDLIIKYAEAERAVKEYGDAIRDLPLKEFERQQGIVDSVRGFAESRNGVTEALGGQIAYKPILQADNADIGIAKGIAEQYKQRMEEAASDAAAHVGKSTEKVFNDLYEQAKTEYIDKISELNNEVAQKINDALAAGKQPIEELENEMTAIQNKANAVSNDVEKLVADGATGTAAQYRQLIEYNNQQMINIEKQKVEWENYRVVVQKLLELFGQSQVNNPLLNSIDEAINGLNEDTRQLIDSTLEYQMMLNGGIELTFLDKEMQDLERRKEEINNEISLAESRTGTVSSKLYQDMANNISDEINNLAAQNAQLQRQSEVVGITAARFDELKSTIASNDSSISSLIQNLEEYNNKLFHTVTDNATNLSSSISNALTESLSGTGVTSATMNSLIGQFSQLQQFTSMDLASVFTNTAKGVQVNVQALQQLVRVQRQAYSKALFNAAIQGQQAVLKMVNKQIVGQNSLKNAAWNTAKVARTADQSQIKGSGAKLRMMNKEIVGYNAIMDAIEMSMSGYQKWQQALSTENPGDRYKTIYEALADIEKQHNEGLVGTDEYKAFISMFDKWGRTTPDAFNDFYPKFERYFYETNEGVKNFANDLVSLGFGTNNNGIYDFDLTDLEQISDAMNVSYEFLDIMFGRLQDYGFNITFAKNELEATAKKLETREDLMKEIERSNYLAANNADIDAINESIARQKELFDNLEDYNEMLQQYQDPDYHEISEEDYTGWINTIKQAQDMMRDALSNGDEEGAAWYASWIEGFAEDHGIALSNNLQEILSPAYDEWIVQYQNKIDEMAKYVPNLSQIDLMFDENSLEIEYKNAFDELQELAKGYPVDIDWEFDPTKADSVDQLKEHLSNLQALSLNIDAQMNPAAKETLDFLISQTETQLNLKYVLENANAGTGIDLEDLVHMTDDEKKEVLMSAALLTDEQTNNILKYLNGEEAKMPMNVSIEQDNIDKLSEAIRDAIIEGLNSGFELGIGGNIADEINKITSEEFHLDEFRDSIIAGTGQTKFGNIDMDKRAIIEWSEELKETYKDALASWEYDPEIGSIDTVFGGSSRFGEDKLEYGVEVAFSPILQTESGAEILNKNTLFDYIESLITDSTTDGQLNIDKMFELDAQGREVGGKFIQNVIAAVDEGIEYANNGNWAETVGRLMHFSGDFGALELEFQNLKAELEDMGLSAEDASAAVETLRNNLATVDSPSEAIQQFVESLGKPLDEANSKVDTYKENLSSLNNVEVTPTVHTEGIDETVNTVIEDKNAMVLIDASKSPKFDNQFTDILDEIETKEPKMNIEITSDMTQVDDIVAKIEAYDSPIIKVNIESNLEQISTDIESNGMLLSVPLDTERIKADLTMLKTTVESENVFNIPIDGNPELLIQEIQYNKAGVESTIAYMPIDGDSKLIVEEAQNDKRGIESTQANMKIGGDSRNLYTELNNDVITIERTYANIHVGANSIELFNSIQNVLNNSRFTATVDANVNATVNLTQLATGTMIAPAHAAGSVALEQDEDALVSELGNESIIAHVLRMLWRTVMCVKINLINCWETLKMSKPQHKDEIYLSVMVAKAEKITYMIYG